MTGRWATLLMAALATVTLSRAEVQARPGSAQPPILAAGDPVSASAKAVLDGLGPIADGITFGRAKAWTVSVENARLVLRNDTDDDAIRLYTSNWTGDRVAGRSISIRVEVAPSPHGGDGPGAGLAFRSDDAVDNYLAWVAKGDGQVALYRRDVSSGLSLLSAYDIPGGHRAAGDLLAVSEQGDTIGLYVNGRFVAAIPADKVLAVGTQDRIGILAVGQGRMAFRTFTVGPPIAGGSASSSGPKIADPPAQDVASLGPLAGEVALGRAGPWTAQADGGRFVLSNSDGAGAVRFYSTQWQGDLAAGRSVGVRVKATGQGPLSGAGLVFRVSDGDPRWFAVVVTSDGKIAAYRRSTGALNLVVKAAIPGGHKADGDLLQINETGASGQVLVNGQPVADIPRDFGETASDPLPVGIVALGTGAFTFGDFAFGPLVKPLVGDDRIPVPGTGDDTVPVPKPPVEPPTPERPAGTVDIPGMGPLGTGVSIGRDGAWTRSVENGRLVFRNDTDENGTYTRTQPWEGTSANGRSVAVRVAVGGTGDGGGGLVFGYADRGSRYLAFVATLDGRAALYEVKTGSLSFVNSIDLPAAAGGDHLLQVSQTGDRTALYADGRLVTTLSPDDGRGLDLSGDVGVIGLDEGRFAFDAFSFGAAAVSDPGTGVSPPGPTPYAGKADPLATEVFGATLGILVHEFGHYAIGELKIPATGPEEDVADELAAMDFVDSVRVDPTVVVPMALGFAKFWEFSAQDRGEEGQPRWYDEHAPDMQRFAKIMCILYGGDPKIFQTFVSAADIPERSQQRCLTDQPKLHRAWEALLKPHRRRGVDALEPGDLDPETPGHKVSVEYHDPKDPAIRPIAEALKRSRTFDMFAEAVTKLYVIPRDTKIVFRDCDKENCFYNPFDGSVTMCWEMISFVIQDFKKHRQADGTATRTP